MKHVKPMNENFDVNNIREILPKMASLGNNSQVTQTASKAIADKLTVSEFRDFVSWLKIVEQQNNINKNKRW